MTRDPSFYLEDPFEAEALAKLDGGVPDADERALEPRARSTRTRTPPPMSSPIKCLQNLCVRQPTPAVGSTVTFPSGLALTVVSGADGVDEEEWDPLCTGMPLLDTSGAIRREMLSEHFSVGDLASHGGRPFDRARIDPKLVRCLEAIWARVGKPIHVNSGYRTWHANKRAYRNPADISCSRHCAGQAADIRIDRMSGLDIARVAIDAWGCRVGVGVGRHFGHVDVRDDFAAWPYQDGVISDDMRAIRAYHRERCSVEHGAGTRRARGRVAHEVSFEYDIVEDLMRVEQAAPSSFGPGVAVLKHLRSLDEAARAQAILNERLQQWLFLSYASRPDVLWSAWAILRNVSGPDAMRGLASCSIGMSTTRSQARGTANARPVEAYYFAGTSEQRALVFAGVHGTERSGMDVVEILLKQLRRSTPYFTTIIIPVLFPLSRARHIYLPRFSGKGGQQVDPNRNFPMPGRTVNDAVRRGAALGIHDDAGAPVAVDMEDRPMAPENVWLCQLVELFRPDRIASVHAHSFRPDRRACPPDGKRRRKPKDAAGITIDPWTFVPGQLLALAMAKLAHSLGARVPGNCLTTKPTTRYPSNAPRFTEGVSFGGWGPDAIANRTTPVITVEVEYYETWTDEQRYPAQSERDTRFAELTSHATVLRTVFLGPPEKEQAILSRP